MTPPRFLGISGVSILLFLAAVPGASASTCDVISYAVDDARMKLKRAAKETDLEDAKDHARRAKNALESAAMNAMGCECDMAYMEFDSAASHARRARDADDPGEFVNSLNKAIRSFNSAILALNGCAGEKR